MTLMKLSLKCIAVLLLAVSSHLVNGQQILRASYEQGHINFVELTYGWNLSSHNVVFGIVTHVNTTPEDDFVSIYYKDFHAFKPLQYFGLTAGYSYRFVEFKYASLSAAIRGTYFPSMGLNRYILSPNGSSSSGGQNYSLDQVVIENGSWVVPISSSVDLTTHISNQVDFIFSVAVGVLLNGDFSNEKYVFSMNGKQQDINSSINPSFRVGLQYRFIK